ncbi:hypothetical protein ACIGMX_34990 [Streptomyces aquilus]|uniref:hypothetical protein n=1 Tax=Streptomyces aquilus TaxID=2548456 RepID=UPI0037CDE1D2
MPDQQIREFLLAAIQAEGGSVTTHRAECLMASSPWPTTGRNTARKRLRTLSREGHLIAGTDATGRRVYSLSTTLLGDQ